MHLRRALLLMALILGVVALVEALVPVPRQRGATQPPAPAAPPSEPAPTRTLQVRYPPRAPVPRLRVGTGSHVVLQVSTSTPGEASIPTLGLVQAAEPATPAPFDLLAARPGTYEISFDPASDGRTAPVGQLVVGGPS
jgi:hypothetical protein